MNTRSFLLGLILSALTPVSLFADIANWGNDDGNEGHRSISGTPYLYIENSILYITSKFQLDNVSIQIKDLSGNILYSTVTTILPETSDPVSLENITEGNYLIELRQGDNYLIKYFTK